jgi:hypothetical protein
MQPFMRTRCEGLLSKANAALLQLKHLGQYIRIDRLDQMAIETRLERRGAIRIATVTGERDQPHLLRPCGGVAADVPRNLVPCESRQSDVDQSTPSSRNYSASVVLPTPGLPSIR